MSETYISHFNVAVQKLIEQIVLPRVVEYTNNTHGTKLTVAELLGDKCLDVKVSKPASASSTVSLVTPTKKRAAKATAAEPRKTCTRKMKRVKDGKEFCGKNTVGDNDYCNACIKSEAKKHEKKSDGLSVQGERVEEDTTRVDSEPFSTDPTKHVSVGTELVFSIDGESCILIGKCPGFTPGNPDTEVIQPLTASDVAIGTNLGFIVVSGVTQVSGEKPSLPAIPTLPPLGNIPSPQIPGLPAPAPRSIPGALALPPAPVASVPAPTSLPSVPQLSAPTALPAVPQLSAPVALPSVPQLPAPTALPSVPQLPAPTALPSVPQLPAVPSLPQISGIPQ